MADTKQERFPDYPIFKGLQRPLEFFGLQGRYIYWAAATAGGAVAGFILETVARAAPAAAFRAAALDHEIGDDPVEVQAVVEAALGQVDEIGDGQRGLVGVQLDLDGAAGGVEGGDQGH